MGFMNGEQELWAAQVSSPPKSPFVDRKRLAATADAQLPSTFFKLPPEIRRKVYFELWGIAGLKQHVITPKGRSSERVFASTPCVCDQNGQDSRFDEFHKDPALWVPRLKSDWCIHWACEELYRASDPDQESSDGEAGDGPLQTTPFLSALLACKQMYLECIESIFENVTFCFTEHEVATEFLGRWEPTSIQHIEICISATNLLTEIYYHSPQGPDPSLPGLPGLTVNNNPWQRLCSALARFDRLRYLSIWFDSKDLRPWYKRVVETRFLDGLDGVRADTFLLNLPALPDRHAQRPLGDAYLEGENLEGRPYAVQRGSRPNRWQIHINFDRQRDLVRWQPPAP